MRRFAFPILLLALVCVQPSPAAVVDGLYEAAVPVSDQGEAARDEALRRAMSAVLVKATGRRDTRGALAPLLDDARRYLQQFRYQQRDTLDPVTGEPREALHLWARFDAAGVQRALLERGVAIWGRERPATLVWLAYDDGAVRELVTADSPGVFRRVLVEAAAARGLPLIEPLMDLEDRAALSYADIWGAFERRLTDASERYAANAVLAGRFFRVDDERWAARWTLLEDGSSVHHESPPGPLAATVADGVHWVADNFAERYSTVPDPAADGRVRVQVDGVGGFRGYARVMNLLRGLSVVNSVQLEATFDDSVLFLLDLRGNVDQLEQSIALGGQLSLHQDGHIAEWGAPLLRYRLRP